MSDRVVGILQARVGSSRLPGKVLMPACGRPLIARMIDRVRRANRLADLWLATSVNPENDALVEEARRLGVPVHRGSEDDVLARFAGAAAQARGDVLVRLTGDCPLHDPAVIDEAVGLYAEGGADYVSNALEPTFPDGLDVEVFSREALDRADREATTTVQREHVTPFIHRHHDPDPARPFRVRHFRAPADFSHLRWTVDEPADYDFVCRVFEALLPSQPDFGWLDVVALLTREPSLLGQNAGFQRNERYFEALRAQGR